MFSSNFREIYPSIQHQDIKRQASTNKYVTQHNPVFLNTERGKYIRYVPTCHNKETRIFRQRFHTKLCIPLIILQQFYAEVQSKS